MARSGGSAAWDRFVSEAMWTARYNLQRWWHHRDYPNCECGDITALLFSGGDQHKVNVAVRDGSTLLELSGLRLSAVDRSMVIGVDGEPTHSEFTWRLRADSVWGEFKPTVFGSAARTRVSYS